MRGLSLLWIVSVCACGCQASRSAGPKGLADGIEPLLADPEYRRKLGEAVVHQAGRYGVLSIYHDDACTPELDGARNGERIRFLINGRPASITNGATPTWTCVRSR